MVVFYEKMLSKNFYRHNLQIEYYIMAGYEDGQFTYGSIPPCRAGEVCREVFAMLSMLYSLEFLMTLRPILCGPPG